VALVAGGAFVTASPASAAVPQFPDNIVVFPNRDMVTLEGYDSLQGAVTIEVTRPGVGVVGSASGPTAAGLEINHPGGLCWGDGTGLEVTPDIRPGDTVSLKQGSTVVGDTVVQDIYVTEPSSLSGNTLTINGHIGPGVDRDQIEQRVIEPALVETDVARRDIRAVPGGPTRAPKGGYESDLVLEGDRFTARYVFDNVETAELADAASGERAMGWQEEDGDANRQGLTIAEFGEPGGPGMGGCPFGPGDSAPPVAGGAKTFRSPDGTQLRVDWTPTAQVPAGGAITGYQVTATDGSGTILGKQAGATATSATITGLTPGAAYSVEVRTAVGSKLGEPFTVTVGGTPTDQGPNPGPGDSTPPTLKISATPGSVTVESDGDVYYAFGARAVFGDMPTESALAYTGPIIVTEPNTEIHFAAFDDANNVTEEFGVFQPASAMPPPAAPAGIGATAGSSDLTVSWTAAAGVTGYSAQLYSDGSGTGSAGAVGAAIETTGTTATFTGLTPSTAYYYTVKAKNAGGYGPESTRLGPTSTTALPSPPAQVTGVTAKAGTEAVTLSWAAVDGSTGYRVRQVDAAGAEVAGSAQETTGLTITVGGLKPGSMHLFQVQARNAAGLGPASAVVSASPADRLTIGTARWKQGDFRVSGTSSATVSVGTQATTVSVFRLLGTNPDGSPNLAEIPNTRVGLTAGIAPASSTYEVRVRNAQAPATNPGTIYVKSNLGGIAGPFTVSNG
jgi:hypothetical protein